MAYTILHISDLHRSPGDPVSNVGLLASLRSDIDRWAHEDTPIPRPDAIVVSGDLVRGVRIGEVDHELTLDRQYADALDFLSQLTDDVISCPRDQVVLVPGNHDVDWNGARAAMTEVAESDLGDDIRLRSFGPESDLRLSWPNRTVFKITDEALYGQRFERYHRLVESFYGPGHDYDPQAYYSTHSLAGGRLGVAGFNSCYGNDCFAAHGAIPEQALAEVYREMRGRGHELLIGVWHHNVEGPPYSTDYMDVAVVHRLIANGFSLGLHGHQHRAQAGVRYVQLPQLTPMALVSAGSLCAGARELPPGVNRQFNVVVLHDDWSGATIHVREIVVSDVWAPARRTEFGGNSFVEVQWGASGGAAVAPAAESQDIPSATLLAAEAALHEGRDSEVIGLLEPYAIAADTYEEGLLIQAIDQGRLWEAAERVFPEPQSANQLALRIEAAIESGRLADAERLFDAFEVRLKIPAAVGGVLRKRLRALEALRQ